MQYNRLPQRENTLLYYNYMLKTHQYNFTVCTHRIKNFVFLQINTVKIAMFDLTLIISPVKMEGFVFELCGRCEPATMFTPSSSLL